MTTQTSLGLQQKSPKVQNIKQGYSLSQFYAKITGITSFTVYMKTGSINNSLNPLYTYTEAVNYKHLLIANKPARLNFLLPHKSHF